MFIVKGINIVSDHIYLFISSLRGGGAERVCTTLANQLLLKGYKVNLIVINLENSIYHKHLNPNINLVNLNKKHARQTFVSIAKLLRLENPKKIFVFNPQISLMLIILKRILKLQTKIISRNINTLSKDRENQTIMNRFVIDNLYKMLYSKSDLLIAQSTGMKQDLIKNYKVPPHKIKVINNPISPNIIRYQNKVYQTNKKKKQILFVGRLTEQKGLQYLLAALSESIKVYPDITLKIIGEGPLKDKLLDQINQMNLNNNVQLKGFQMNIAPYYLESTVTVLSSIYEGFPNVLIESIALGTPVVAFDCPSGPSEIIIENVNGYLVDYKNSKDLSKKILKALSRVWDRSQIMNTSKIYNEENIIRDYIACIN